MGITAANQSQSIMVSNVYNKKTGKYEVKVGDKTIEVFSRKTNAEHFIKQNEIRLLREAAPLGDVTKSTNPKHPSNTKLGTAKPTSSSGMTWARYAEEHGTTYTQPISGVVEADRRAEAIIRQNQQAITAVDESANRIKVTPQQAITAVDESANRVKVTPQKGKFSGLLNKLGKVAKWGVVAVLVGVVGSLIINKCTGENKNEEVRKPSPTVQPDPEVKPVEPDKPTTPVEPAEPNEPENKHLPLDETGTYTVKKGDSYWSIAERHLKDKFKNEPDKFENLPETKRNAMIIKEQERIMSLRGAKYDKDHWDTEEKIKPGDKILVEFMLERVA